MTSREIEGGQTRKFSDATPFGKERLQVIFESEYSEGGEGAKNDGLAPRRFITPKAKRSEGGEARNTLIHSESEREQERGESRVAGPRRGSKERRDVLDGG